MPSTRLHHSPDLALRPQPESATKTNATTASKGQHEPIPYDVWMQFHAVIANALIPYKEPMEKVKNTVLELEKKLGIVI